MSSAHLLRLQIESALADRIPSALTPAPRVIRPTASTGIAALDAALSGGLPLGAISELAGPECSGRTTLARAFVAGLTQEGRVCAWVDVSDTLDPESAAASGVDLARLLWVRCGGAAGAWEQTEPAVAVAVGAAVSDKCPTRVGHEEPSFEPRCAERQAHRRRDRLTSGAKAPSSLEAVSARLKSCPDTKAQSSAAGKAAPERSGWREVRMVPLRKPWSRLDQALRATDLLLQAGGFSAIVLDMGSIAPEFALRVPLATWFRYRAAAERTQASVILLTQQACAKSSAGLVLRLQPGEVLDEGATVLTGAEFYVERSRERFAPVTEFMRKPPQSDPTGRTLGPRGGSGKAVRWQSRTAWADRVNGSEGGSR
ncbi:MAG: recombinase RecA [Acidobacteriaceae bacterium]